ncbi:MAG TPA: ZIP family metal transporter [Vicinamibacterales bacterium]|nr:ZIP family metal transporter [Vicinamibacterales bacterium]
MPIWIDALALAVAGSVGGLLTASILLVVSQPIRDRVVPWLVSYAVGTLLGAALLALTPQALASLPPPRVFGSLLAGIMTFFVLEKLVLWRHSHDDHECDVHKSTVTLVIVGDAVHTFVDGVVIAAAVLVSLPLGLTTALAVAAHEIPQEAGDFAILLAAGHSRARALLLNLTSAIGGLLGAGAMLLFGEHAPHALPYILAFAAGNFLYVAMADLIPTLHRGTLDRNAVRQLALIGFGVATIAIL